MPQIIADNSGSIPAGFIPSKLTYDEFLVAYDGRYAEYIEGEVIVPMSVTQRHDDLTGFLLALLRIFVEERKLGKVKGEPYQMKMMLDNTIKGREPDIFFVGIENLDKIGDQFYDGAADLVIEVISPDSIIRDTQEKFEEYEEAGVKEYWIIDPNRRTANFYGYDLDRKYQLLRLNADGRFESRVIDGLWIDTEWLWQEDLPTVVNVLRQWEIL